MKIRLYFLFTFFTLLFLFYPGDSPYIQIFAFNRPLFESRDLEPKFKKDPIPYTKFQTEPAVTGLGVYIVDLPTFTPVFQKNPHEKMLPASTTKIITALVAADIYDPDEVLTVKRILSDGQAMGLVAGEKITVENLLYGILVQSGNDAAYVLADQYGFEKFVIRMDQKRISLGMKDTHFTNPAGLDDFNQYTTPFDLAIAARELLNKPLLRKIVATKEIVIADIDFKYFHTLSNVNKLLGEVQGIGGLKTGYTENAKENLVSFYKSNGHQFIIVILKSDDRFADTREVINWINTNIDYLNSP